MPPDQPHGFAAMPAFIARDGTIDTSTKALLLILSSFAGADQSCFPSNATLCECAGLSESTVRRLLRDAEERGLVVTTRRTAQNGAPLSNLYRLNFAKWGTNTSDSDTRSNLQGVGVMDAPRVGAPVEGGWAHPSAPNKTKEQDQGTRPSFALASDTPSNGRQEPKPAKPTPKPKPQWTPPTREQTFAIFAAFAVADGRAPESVRAMSENCWKYFERGGWKDKKNEPVKNWKLRCGTWYGNEANDARNRTTKAPAFTYPTREEAAASNRAILREMEAEMGIAESFDFDERR